MNTRTRRTSLAAALACLALTASACGDEPTGPTDGVGPFRVSLSSANEVNSEKEPARATVPETPLQARLGLDAVESIILPIGAIEAREDGGAWVEAGSVDFAIDLLNLPPGGLVILQEELDTGSYTGLRLYLLDTPTVVLTEDVEVGRTLFAAGEHDLVIPSAAQTGVKLNADFVVDEGGEALTIVFDPDAALEGVTATGSGTLMISPVLQVLNSDGDEVGEIDDDEDGAELTFEGTVASVSEGSFTLADGTTVVVTGETELGGDLLGLAALAAAVTAGESVRAEGEGEAGSGPDVIVATEVEFEVEGGAG